MRKIIVFLLTITVYYAGAQSIKQLKQDMYGIASDATEGRFTASPGYLRAAKFTANQLRAAGLKVKFQAVPFIYDNYDKSSLATGNSAYSHYRGDFVVLQYAEQQKGDWVILNSIPDSAAVKNLINEKVAGVIILPDSAQSQDWETTVIRQRRFGYMHYKVDYLNSKCSLTYILVSPSIAQKLKKGKKPNLKLYHRLDRINGYNVIASLPGTDKKLADQAIIAGAHLDHIGRFDNHIYNGANDDASGCVALLSAARSLSASPVKRPLLFIFYCGEELNLLGSRYFVEHPSIPINNIIMNINLEQVGSRHRSFHGIWAIGDRQFKNNFRQSATMFARQDLQFTPADSLRDVLSNTDSYSFMKKNVPSLLLGSGGFDEHHSVKDKIDLIDFDHLKKASELLYGLLVKIGNSQQAKDNEDI